MGVQTDSRIDDDWIVWEDERNGSSAIYGSALPSFKKARIHRAREERNMRIRIGVKDPMKELLEMSVETASGKIGQMDKKKSYGRRSGIFIFHGPLNRWLIRIGCINEN